jgi:hypothetical protein
MNENPIRKAHVYRDSNVKCDGYDVTRGQVLEINCRECGASPGERCVSTLGSGRVRYDPHFYRKLDREKGADPGPTPTREQRLITAVMNDVHEPMRKRPHEWSWTEVQAWVISLTIRNALEVFHGGGAHDPENPDSGEGFITDRQMKAMNIVIRHAVTEAVKHLEHPKDNLDYINWTLAYINDYMEPPGSLELERAYNEIKEGRFDPPGFVPDCTKPSHD